MNPITPHTSWAILDSTKIKAYQECPRSFFYEYILGWRSSQPNLHLEFGKAWHYAMEHLLLNGYGQRSIAEALILLTNHYRKFFPEHMDADFAPKNPSYALTALVKYAQEYANDKYEVLYTEVAGTVPLSMKHRVHFRIDSILRIDGLVRSREHKTGSQVSRQWADQWLLSPQTFVYNHVLHCIYPINEVWGVEINGAFLQKKEHKFMRVPCRVNMPIMEARYWSILDDLDRLDEDMDRLAEASDGDSILSCFPMRPAHCSSYFGCKYLPFCTGWANPLQRCTEVPEGFKIEYWDPSEEESTAKKVFHLEGR